MNYVVVLLVTSVIFNSDFTAIMTPPVGLLGRSFLCTSNPRLLSNTSDECMSSLSHVSVPKIMSGLVVSITILIYLLFFLALWKLMFKIRKYVLMFLFLTCWVGLGYDACIRLPMVLNVELDRSVCGSSNGTEDVEGRESETDVDRVLLIIALELNDE